MEKWKRCTVAYLGTRTHYALVAWHLVLANTVLTAPLRYRKKAEQAEAREQIKKARQGGASLGEGTGRLGNESLADA